VYTGVESSEGVAVMVHGRPSSPRVRIGPGEQQPDHDQLDPEQQQHDWCRDLTSGFGEYE